MSESAGGPGKGDLSEPVRQQPPRGFEHEQETRFTAQREELERAYQAMEVARRRYYRLFHQAPVGYVTLSATAAILEANATFARMVGDEIGTLVGRPFFDFLPEPDRGVFLSRFRAFLRQPGGKRMDARIRSASGGLFHARLEAVPEAQEGGSLPAEEGLEPRLFLTVSDISELQETARALGAEREHLATTLDSIGDGVIVTDVEGRIERMNPVAQELTGWSVEEARGRGLGEVFVIRNARTGQVPEDPVQLVLREGSVVGLANHTVLRARDGRDRQIADSAAPVRAPDGTLEGVVLVFRDVTHEYRTQEELRFQATCLEQVRDLVLATDLDGVIRYVNQAESHLFGRPREFFLGQPLSVLVGGAEGDPQGDILEAARRSGSWRGRVVNTLPGGDTVLLDCRVQTLLDEEGEPMGLLGISTDVTEQVKAQEDRAALQQQLHQSSKMEAVGRLAGGIAHDFNNLLTAVLGNVEMALLDLSPLDPLRGMLEEVSKAGSTAAELTQRLLAFSRKQIIEPRVLSLNEQIRVLHRMLSRVIGEHIQLEVELAPDLRAVRLDPSQLEQMLVNLAVNARDAMPEGGLLRIRTSMVELDESHQLRHPALEPGSFVAVEVSDTGHGMTTEVLAHAFEPFFTTKPVGEGTGLGLSIIHGAVTQAGGAVEVSSAPGAGSTFTLYIPAVGEPPLAAPKRAARAGEARGGDETVLLVEDEPLVQGLAVKILERAGYAVLSAANGAEALRVAQAHPGPIHLLVTDVVMPGMAGTELAERLQKRLPGLDVVFTSGYAQEYIADRGVLEPDLDFLPKPYMPRELLARVREALDRPPGPPNPDPESDTADPA